ncbi:MAG: hypothetical protein U0800_10355 [Isosphaeraceae bacterium]
MSNSGRHGRHAAQLLLTTPISTTALRYLNMRNTPPGRCSD